ncbi:phosphatidylglycerophosphate phosphatase PTPMT1-like [Mercurialis annua]|uniref:phosphatidylglycerophosphate phosphatase PTPMT1-like n=1 Tax=Mercurialis annua TaxID=3986 RepID=UPI0021608D55|nr:phosphatidylglycerophosphate phosphatase PTPMT1-like [Mercurialis annua]
MIIEELKKGGGGGEVERVEEEKLCVSIVDNSNRSDDDEVVVVVWDVKRVLVGAGARALFYPTLFYNVVRNKMQVEFRWWDRVDQFILLGAVPFPTDVPRLKEHGVIGVITLNEPYETLVPTSLYQAHGIDHLVIPTRDYCFAPSLRDICLAVDFIHENALQGGTTYVHCKAGRGRSTTVVICYLVQHRQMTPDAAYDYVKSIRPRVLLASAQWQAVQEYYNLKVKSCEHINRSDLILQTPKPTPLQDIMAFDDGSVVVVTESDLQGYDPNLEMGTMGGEVWADLSLVYRVGAAGQAALARISCQWFRCQTNQKILGKQMTMEKSCSITAGHLRSISVDIHVY